MEKLNDIATEYKRGILREKLKECTPTQIDLFNKMYVSIDKIEEKNMDWAYQQIMNTITH